MISGEVLKYRKGERWVMVAGYGGACTCDNWVSLILPKGYIEASDVEPVIGALLTIRSVMWSVADKRAR